MIHVCLYYFSTFVMFENAHNKKQTKAISPSPKSNDED